MPMGYDALDLSTTTARFTNDLLGDVTSQKCQPNKTSYFYSDRNGADLKPLLEKLVLAEKSRLSKRPQSHDFTSTTLSSTTTPTASCRPKETKMVTFKDEAKLEEIDDAKHSSDAFM